MSPTVQVGTDVLSLQDLDGGVELALSLGYLPAGLPRQGEGSRQDLHVNH